MNTSNKLLVKYVQKKTWLSNMDKNQSLLPKELLWTMCILEVYVLYFCIYVVSMFSWVMMLGPLTSVQMQKVVIAVAQFFSSKYNKIVVSSVFEVDAPNRKNYTNGSKRSSGSGPLGTTYIRH